MYYFRRNLRNTSHELLELEQVLKNAYIHKELAAQIEYKRGERLYDKVNFLLCYKIILIIHFS